MWEEYLPHPNIPSELQHLEGRRDLTNVRTWRPALTNAVAKCVKTLREPTNPAGMRKEVLGQRS